MSEHDGLYKYRREPREISQHPAKRSPVSFEKVEEPLAFFRRVARWLGRREK